MDITPAIPDHYKIINSYSKGSFKVNNISYENNIIISESSVEEWPFQLTKLTIQSFENIIANFHSDKSDPLVLLLGTGSTHLSLPDKLKKKLEDNNIILDIVSTPAACRTYNVLVTEGRKAIAILYICSS